MLYTFLLLNLRNNNDIFEFSIETDWCGEISIDYAEVWIYDCFKLFKRPGRETAFVRTVIYPKEGSVSIGTMGNYAGVIREEDMVQNRKDNNPSEIELEPYEERTLQNFLEKLLSDTRKMGWKIWLKRRYVYIWKNRR